VGEVREMYRFDPARFDDHIKLLTEKYAQGDDLDENRNLKMVYNEMRLEAQNKLKHV
jgi:hypothetical protein